MASAVSIMLHSHRLIQQLCGRQLTSNIQSYPFKVAVITWHFNYSADVTCQLLLLQLPEAPQPPPYSFFNQIVIFMCVCVCVFLKKELFLSAESLTCVINLFHWVLRNRPHKFTSILKCTAHSQAIWGGCFNLTQRWRRAALDYFSQTKTTPAGVRGDMLDIF